MLFLGKSLRKEPLGQPSLSPSPHPEGALRQNWVSGQPEVWHVQTGQGSYTERLSSSRLTWESPPSSEPAAPQSEGACDDSEKGFKMTGLGLAPDPATFPLRDPVFEADPTAAMKVNELGRPRHTSARLWQVLHVRRLPPRSGPGQPGPGPPRQPHLAGGRWSWWRC